MKRVWLLLQFFLGSGALSPSRALDTNSTAVGGPSCFCDDPSLCTQLQTGHRKEIYGFQSREERWRNIDLDTVTTIAWAKGDELTCAAHAKSVRVIMEAPNPVPLTGDASIRKGWIRDIIEIVKKRFMDGVVFDYEEPLPPGDPRAEYYVQLVNETTAAFHEALPGSQVSVCLAWSPNGIDGRWYDNLGLIQAADLAYIMVYDTRSQIFDQCVASANAALPLTALGLQQYLALGADPDKLILGVPWYGYDYPCVDQDDPKATTCRIPFSPFRGVNCSDAAGRQLEYRDILAKLAAGNTTTGRRWEEYMHAPYYNWIDEKGLVRQMWYDDPEALRSKYELAREMGLRGVGPYCFDFLDPDGELNASGSSEAAAMWEAFTAFTGPGEKGVKR